MGWGGVGYVDSLLRRVWMGCLDGEVIRMTTGRLGLSPLGGGIKGMETEVEVGEGFYVMDVRDLCMVECYSTNCPLFRYWYQAVHTSG